MGPLSFKSAQFCWQSGSHSRGHLHPDSGSLAGTGGTCRERKEDNALDTRCLGSVGLGWLRGFGVFTEDAEIQQCNTKRWTFPQSIESGEWAVGRAWKLNGDLEGAFQTGRQVCLTLSCVEKET